MQVFRRTLPPHCAPLLHGPQHSSPRGRSVASFKGRRHASKPAAAPALRASFCAAPPTGVRQSLIVPSKAAVAIRSCRVAADTHAPWCPTAMNGKRDGNQASASPRLLLREVQDTERWSAARHGAGRSVSRTCWLAVQPTCKHMVHSEAIPRSQLLGGSEVRAPPILAKPQVGPLTQLQRARQAGASEETLAPEHSPCGSGHQGFKATWTVHTKRPLLAAVLCRAVQENAGTAAKAQVHAGATPRHLVSLMGAAVVGAQASAVLADSLKLRH